MQMRYTAVSAAMVVACAASASAELVTGFSFNTITSNGPVSAPLAADYGVGAYTTNFADGDVFAFSGTTLGAVTGDVAGRAPAFRNGEGAQNNGAYAQFAFDSTGYADLVLSFATKTTATTGFTSMDIQVSGNGVDFTTVETLLNLRDDLDWTLKTVDLSAAAVLDDNADAAIRVVFYGGDASNAVANTRIENFLIHGTAVPTPGAAALLGLSGLAVTRRRRA